MSECLVCLGHLVDVLALLDGFTLVLGSKDDLLSEALLHRDPFPAAGCADDPLHAKLLLALGPHFARNLIVGTANTARADLHCRSGVLQGRLKDLERVGGCLFLNDIKGVVHHGACSILLAIKHAIVDELADLVGIEAEIRWGDIPVLYFSSHEKMALLSFRTLSSVLAPSLPAGIDACCVENAADDRIPEPDILHAAALNDDN